MCGITGGFWVEPMQASKRVSAAMNEMRHRGPDDTGLESFPVKNSRSLSGANLVLGHTRLSIIDLSPRGHQPMHFGDKRYSIVFNGEIYNYRELRNELKSLGHSFVTGSETEVLLAAWASWGVKGLRHR